MSSWKHILMGMVLAGILPVRGVAQTKYVSQWDKILGGGYPRYPQDMAVDTAGNSYSVGFASNGSDYDFYTVKVDSMGNEIWERWFQSFNSHDEHGHGVAVDKYGSVYVTGDIYGTYNMDLIVVKYSPDSTEVWADTIDNGNDDNGSDIAVDPITGNVYIAGDANNGAHANYYVLELDSLGNIVWADTIIKDSASYAKGVAVDTSGNLWVIGSFKNDVGNWDIMIYKYTNHQRVDSLKIDNWSDDEGYDIVADEKGNVYFVGWTYINPNQNILVGEVNQDAQIVWADTIAGGKGTHIAYYAGNLYVSGFLYNSSTGHDNAFVVRYDSLHNIVWADTVEYSSNNTYADGVGVDKYGNIYMLAHIYAPNSRFLIRRYAKYRDIGMLDVLSGDTATFNEDYVPEVKLTNNSFEFVLDFGVVCQITDTLSNIMYVDTQYVTGMQPGDTSILTFSTWTTPAENAEYTVTFYPVGIVDLDQSNDTISNLLTVRDLTPPYIVSATAFDGTNPGIGIDDDDYVLITFSEPTNAPTIDASNINSVFALSSGHTWLDGFGNLGDAVWNSSGTQLIIHLTTNVSLPTVSVGDTIYPDGVTITDSVGNVLSAPVVIDGTFGKDMGCASIIAPPQQVYADSIYTPGVMLKNYSSEAFSGLTVRAFIDSSGTIIYADTQNVDLAGEDSVEVFFADWQAPSGLCLLKMGFEVLNANDLDAGNDTISQDMAVLSDVKEGVKVPDRTVLLVPSIVSGRFDITYAVANNSSYTLSVYGVDGKLVKRVEGRSAGIKTLSLDTPSGIYYVILKQGTQIQKRKVSVFRK